ncbi:hypothetical protein QVD17_10163 [Tagetes erecta]|uniref:Uncharacterized protein n=1 Tax=Tagetes erecta TaxID=13708 RepID=A0AAD8L2S8_TARER|nr:hypothetical protein QVD17_10163 [Tagetes erecta]
MCLTKKAALLTVISKAKGGDQLVCIARVANSAYKNTPVTFSLAYSPLFHPFHIYINPSNPLLFILPLHINAINPGIN